MGVASMCSIPCNEIAKTGGPEQQALPEGLVAGVGWRTRQKALASNGKDVQKTTRNAASGVYAGETTADGKREGRGKFTYPNADWYDGEWVDGKATGAGTFKTRDSTYTGQWDQDLKHGHGEEIFEDSTYSGEFRMGYRHGRGTLSWKDGSSYTGHFVNNNQEGHGTYTWKNRNAYTGQWSDNYMHGEGRYDWADGSSYVGQYNMNLKDGEGTFCSKEGMQLKCAWALGKPCGQVSFLMSSVESRPALWSEGVMVSWALRSEESTPRP
mmetsp:Transcript_94691/g.294917  ORF Transcript_94691/g.294917 Transcript_94691/m.294917 type:complete len:268 (+) Transcript_94691:114-917(+)